MNDDTSPVQAPPTDDQRVAATAQLQAQYLELTPAVAHEEDNPEPAPPPTAEQVADLVYEAGLAYRWQGTHPDPTTAIGGWVTTSYAALEHLAYAVVNNRDLEEAVRRAAVIAGSHAVAAGRSREALAEKELWDEDYFDQWPGRPSTGTPVRCTSCPAIYMIPTTDGYQADLSIAGREDTLCPKCAAEQPPPPVIEPAAVHSPGRRRKPATPARPRTASRQARNGSTP